VLAGLGGGISLPKLNTAFKKARKVQFTFANVESTSITPFALGKFLAAGTLDTSNPFVTQYFGNDETQEYIIFDVLKSDSLSVTAKTETGVEVDADVGALAGGVTANVKASAGAAGSSEITFQGSVKATFAFKLYGSTTRTGSGRRVVSALTRICRSRSTVRTAPPTGRASSSRQAGWSD
jgi:hypothetical protein